MSERITLARLVSRHRRPPATAYLTVVEATSFVAFGGFIGSDDLATLFQSEIEQGKEGDDATSDVKHEWSHAGAAILAKAGANGLTLLGRWAPQFGADPVGDHVPIPAEFFASERDLVVNLTNAIYVRNDPRRAMYYEIRVRTDDFTDTFPAAKPTRRATSEEKKAILAYAERVYAETRRATSETDLWDAFPQVSRSSLREIIKELPTHLQRERGK